MSDQTVFSSVPQDESPGDSGDQAQRLQMAEEAEAIAAALAGSPRGDDSDTGRPGRVEMLEGEDPVSSSAEQDSSDDPTYGGGDVTGQDPAQEAAALRDEEF
jgi:hypothetical protein